MDDGTESAYRVEERSGFVSEVSTAAEQHKVAVTRASQAGDRLHTHRAGATGDQHAAAGCRPTGGRRGHRTCTQTRHPSHAPAPHLLVFRPRIGQLVDQPPCITFGITSGIEIDHTGPVIRALQRRGFAKAPQDRRGRQARDVAFPWSRMWPGAACHHGHTCVVVTHDGAQRIEIHRRHRDCVRLDLIGVRAITHHVIEAQHHVGAARIVGVFRRQRFAEMVNRHVHHTAM